MGQLDVCRLLAAAVVDREVESFVVGGNLEAAVKRAQSPGLGSIRINLLPEERLLLSIPADSLRDIALRFIPD